MWSFPMRFIQLNGSTYDMINKKARQVLVRVITVITLSDCDWCCPPRVMFGDVDVVKLSR